jgi:predicted DNA-binding transcriptional regulator AlpA
MEKNAPSSSSTSVDSRIVDAVDQRIIASLAGSMDRLNATMADFHRLMVTLTVPVAPARTNDELLSLREVRSITGFGERHLRAVGSSGRDGFPKAIKLSGRLRWRRSDLEEWMKSRPTK